MKAREISEKLDLAMGETHRKVVKVHEDKLSCRMPRDAGKSSFTLSNAAIASLKDAGRDKDADAVLNFYTKNQPDLVSMSNFIKKYIDWS